MAIAERSIDQYIEANPSRPGADEVVLVEHGIPVWALIGAITLAGSTPDEVAADNEIPRAAVDAAMRYYKRHRAVIDARIAANQQFSA